MKTISILLTKYSDFMSRCVNFISGEYTHISLSLDEDLDKYYSFNYKGFCIETTEKHRKRGVKKSLCYQIDVDDDVYDSIKNYIMFFEDNKKSFRYTRVGVIFCAFGIPFERKNCYFCSKFVAEVLSYSGSVKLSKKPCCYLPNHFVKLLERHPKCTNVMHNIV